MVSRDVILARRSFWRLFASFDARRRVGFARSSFASTAIAPWSVAEDFPSTVSGSDCIITRPIPNAYYFHQANRRRQAARSILVQAADMPELLQILDRLQQFAPRHVCEVFKCSSSLPGASSLPAALVEFTTDDHVTSLVTAATTSRPDLADANRFLRMRNIEGPLSRFADSSMKSDPIKSTQLSNELLLEKMRQMSSVDEQIQALIKETELDEYAVRIRHFVALLVQESLQTVQPGSRCYPFGSTTNGFGRRNCDVDMEFVIKQPDQELKGLSRSAIFRRVGLLLGASKHLRNNATTLDVGNFVKVPGARVPILKFSQIAAGVPCDLAFHRNDLFARVGSCMSELLWIYSRWHPCVRPLAFTVRRWAAVSGLTHHAPGAWFTNFQLILLVLYFLIGQKRLLPVAGDLIEAYNLGTDPIFGPDCLIKLKERGLAVRETVPKEDLKELVMQFFDFYLHKLDFAKFGISLKSLELIEKPKPYAIWLQNPFERGHNITSNVNAAEKGRLISAMDAALRTLETTPNEPRDGEDWGLLPLFRPTPEAARWMREREGAGQQWFGHGDMTVIRTMAVAEDSGLES